VSCGMSMVLGRCSFSGQGAIKRIFMDYVTIYQAQKTDISGNQRDLQRYEYCQTWKPGSPVAERSNLCGPDGDSGQ
jgi:hypothetical protein